MRDDSPRPAPCLDTIRAQQALAILDQLERLQPGDLVAIVRLPQGGWGAFKNGTASHRGESATDALGQLTTVLALEAS